MSEVRFAFLADMQLGCYAGLSGLTAREVAGLRERGMEVAPVPAATGFAWDAHRYERAVEAVGRLRPDAVVMGGDMVDDCSDDAQIEAFRQITGRLDSGIPIHLAPGNHDVAFDGVHPTAASLDRYRSLFGPDYYSARIGPVRLLVLDTPLLGYPEACPMEADAQLAFLERELASPPPWAETTVMIGHHPLFVDEPDEPDSYWNVPLERRRILLDLVGRAGVRLGLAGHLHRNVTGRAGAFEMVTSGAVGYPLGRDPSGFRIVRVADGSVTHEYVALGTPFPGRDGPAPP